MNNNVILEFKRSDIRLDNLDVVDSKRFEDFIKAFFKEYSFIGRSESSVELFIEYKDKYDEFIYFLRKIITKDKETINFINSFDDEKKLEYLALIDDVYDFWRNKHRFLLLNNVENGENAQKLISFFNYMNETFENFYRYIYEIINGNYQTNYRELPAGFNSGILTKKYSFLLPENLQFVNEIKSVETVVTRPPFMFNSKQNTRKGTFLSINHKITSNDIKKEDFISVLIKVNHKRGLILIHKDYLYYLPSLANLFELSVLKEGEHIDFMVFFGVKNNDEEPYYYQENELYVGVLPTKFGIDYFGYLKKMILTLFNLIQIDNGNLPIHGAGVQISMSNGKIYNICFLGDSGAGKSETLEAIKNLKSKNIKSIKTIFDDMGTFYLNDNKVYMSGTEIGAFVRVDDLDKGYPLKSVDRAIYMNIDETNSRTIIPIIDYRSTCQKYCLDYFFLTDNFTDSFVGIEQFINEDVALSEFKKGERKAKGTTDEIGLVTTYFANPFGPSQREKVVDSFIGNYFSSLYKNKVYVGRLYSRLSIDANNGPKIAANSLISLLMSK